MTAPTSVEVVEERVGHLIDRVEKLEDKSDDRFEKLEAKLEAERRKGDIQAGVAVGFGAIMTLLTPKIAEVLGLS
jgi:hypothetical protein